MLTEKQLERMAARNPGNKDVRDLLAEVRRLAAQLAPAPAVPAAPPPFTRTEVAGALRNGTRVEKVNSDPGDAQANGASARVLGSTGEGGQVTGYFVEWKELPGVPSYVPARQIRPEL